MKAWSGSIEHPFTVDPDQGGMCPFRHFYAGSQTGIPPSPFLHDPRPVLRSEN